MKKILFLFCLIPRLIFSQTGTALNFDGINDYVILSNTNNPYNVSVSHIKTFQVWFKNTSYQGSHVRIFSTGTANWTTGVWFGYASGSSYLRFELCDGISYPGLAITGTTAIRGDNQWHQATGIINGNIAILYLDAAYQGSVNISGLGAMNPAGPVHVGNSYNNESASYFQGNIDELRVWDRVLCQQEIMSTMNCELSGSESGLVAYYKFDNGIASGNNSGIINLPDYTINANNGTLTNFGLTGSSSNWVSPGGVITGSLCGVISPTICSPQQTGINTLVADVEIKITSDNNQFNIISERHLIQSVNVFDLTGRLILENNNIKENSVQIELTNQHKGLYFIMVTLADSQRKTFKVLNK